MRKIVFGALLCITPKLSPTHLIEAIKEKNLPMAHMLISENQGLSIPDRNGATPLHWAAARGLGNIVTLLLITGVDVDSKATNEETPLHWAIWNKKREVAKLLLDGKADVNAQSTDGWTPLHVAAVRGFIPIARLLIDRGANRDIEDGRGRKAVYLTTNERVIDGIVQHKPRHKRRNPLLHMLKQGTKPTKLRLPTNLLTKF